MYCAYVNIYIYKSVCGGCLRVRINIIFERKAIYPLHINYPKSLIKSHVGR